MSHEYLVVLSFLTSALTGVAGIGGGVILISLMPLFLPAAAIVPVHGVVQLGSNVSRVGFALKNMRWSYFLAFLPGAALAVFLGGQISLELEPQTFKLLLGSFILALMWLPIKQLYAKIPGKFLTLGFCQTFLSLFVGAGGPLSAALLEKERLPRDEYVVTGAGLMSLMHCMKVFTFAFLVGFSFQPYLPLLGGLLTATVLGSFVGTKLRERVPQALFQKGVFVLLNLLATSLLLQALFL